MSYNKRRGKTFYESNYPIFGGLFGLVLFAAAVLYFGGGSSFRAVGAGIFGAIICGAILGFAVESIVDDFKKPEDTNDSLDEEKDKIDPL